MDVLVQSQAILSFPPIFLNREVTSEERYPSHDTGILPLPVDPLEEALSNIIIEESCAAEAREEAAADPAVLKRIMRPVLPAQIRCNRTEAVAMTAFPDLSAVVRAIRTLGCCDFARRYFRNLG